MNPPHLEWNPVSKEPPLLAELRGYWQRKRGSRRLPSRRDIQPGEIRSLLPYVILVEPVEGGRDFRYRLVGSRLHDYFPVQPTGQLMSAMLAPFGTGTVDATLDAYRAVLAGDEPLRLSGDGAWFAQSPKFFEALLTPLSDDGAQADMIFGAFQFEWNHARMPADDPSGTERALAEALAER
ncbi:MAG: PAS domain-containing protein [Rhizomicrobium sp.]